MINLESLLNLLNKSYLNQYNTIIVGGYDEPFYQSSKNGQPAEIQFSFDYIRSALHELSHWCVAGKNRRMLDDYGYWYAKDGRSQSQQNVFYQVELKPQSYEWVFSLACEVPFEASVDNLNNTVDGVEKFQQQLVNQLAVYYRNGLPKRVSQIANLFTHYELPQKNIFDLMRDTILLNGLTVR